MAPKGDLIDTIRTKSNKWTIYKVHEFMSTKFYAYKNGEYVFTSEDLRYVVERVNEKG